MFSRLLSGTVVGIDAELVEVQCDVAPGLPSFNIVGLPEKEISESRDRIRSAIKNASFSFPPGRITANLAPADIRKGGVGFDLPIALSILAASDQIPGPPADCLIIGELSLDGAVRAVAGVLPLALEGLARGTKRMLVPPGNAEEAGMVEGVDIHPVRTLTEAAEYVRGEQNLPRVRTDVSRLLAEARGQIRQDLADVRGQLQAKRALEIAAAGGHNLLLCGPPGAGKSLLAKCVPDLLPPLSLEEALEVSRVYSIAGLLQRESPILVQRPFRAPHHTISYAGMVGGGHGIPGPGEISLAHHGVLFLDELPEFSRRVLETLRQPLEERQVLLSRAGVSIRYPASFTLIAAMNPCPCGFLGDAVQSCVCTLRDLHRYRRRLSGPFLDRMDLFVDVPRLPADDLFARGEQESTTVVRERIARARTRQWVRFAGCTEVRMNAHLDGRLLAQHCPTSPDVERLLRRAIARFGLSARGHVRILRVARTVADLEGETDVGPEHLAEAIQFRTSRISDGA